MKTLPFKAEDLIGGAGAYSERTRRSSISGVQDKVQLLHKPGGYEVVESGGTHILKPVPRSGYMRLAGDVPANEALTMDIAQRVFRIQVARHELVRLADGELAYLTERFDRQNGRKILQEDFASCPGGRRRRMGRTTSMTPATKNSRNWSGGFVRPTPWRIRRFSS